MDVRVDTGVCSGYGNCVLAAPEVFDLDPDAGVAQVLPGRPLPSDAAAVGEAAADCPTRAISVRGR
ncbi:MULTISPECIES: ferredoxin [unclassified Blastococcus]